MRESGHQGSYPQLQQVLRIFTQVEHYANRSKVYGKQGKYESENGSISTEEPTTFLVAAGCQKSKQ